MNCTFNMRHKNVSFNSKQAGGGGAPPLVFFCPSTLIFDTITMKFKGFFCNLLVNLLGYRAESGVCKKNLKEPITFL